MKSSVKNTILLFCLIGVLLLSGCVSYSFDQKVERDGKSILRLAFDIKNAAPSVTAADMNKFYSQMSDICANLSLHTPAITCNADKSVMKLERALSKSDGYTFTTVQGLPYNTYKISVNTIYAEKLLPQAEKNMLGAYGMFAPQIIDFTDKAPNKELADQMKKFGVKADYTIEMPGEVTAAYAGDAQAQIDGSTATFDLVQVLDKSAPLTVESRELNTSTILMIVLVLVLLVVLFSFLQVSKKR